MNERNVIMLESQNKFPYILYNKLYNESVNHIKAIQKDKRKRITDEGTFNTYPSSDFCCLH